MHFLLFRGELVLCLRLFLLNNLNHLALHFSINLTIVDESVTTIGMPYATQEQPCLVGMFTDLKKICYFTRKQLRPRDVAKSLMALMLLLFRCLNKFYSLQIA